MKCETCGFDLPDDWPPTTVEVKPTAVPLASPVVTTKILCAPCARRVVTAPVQDRPGPTMTDYHALPPHVPAGRRKETKP